VTFKVVTFKDQNSQTANPLHFLMDKPPLHTARGGKPCLPKYNAIARKSRGFEKVLPLE
jgi:hypothetical protein